MSSKISSSLIVLISKCFFSFLPTYTQHTIGYFHWIVRLWRRKSHIRRNEYNSENPEERFGFYALCDYITHHCKNLYDHDVIRMKNPKTHAIESFIVPKIGTYIDFTLKRVINKRKEEVAGNITLRLYSNNTFGVGKPNWFELEILGTEIRHLHNSLKNLYAKHGVSLEDIKRELYYATFTKAELDSLKKSNDCKIRKKIISKLFIIYTL